MGIFKLVYNSFIWGLVLSILAFQNQWLEMRINIGFIIPSIILIALMYFIVLKLYKNKDITNKINVKFTIINLILSSIVILLILGIERTKILPASIIREGINMTSIPFETINLYLISFLIIGIIIIFYFEMKYKDEKGGFCMDLKKSTIYKINGIVILLACYFFIPGVKESINKVTFILSKVDIPGMKEYIKSFGMLAPLVSIALMMFQSIAAPLPAFVITFANAWIFGWVWGAIISWSGAMLGAVLCFYISKFYGRPAAEKFVGKKSLDMTDDFFKKYGEYAILIARLLPFISFDIVSYAAGLTGMSFWSFFWATGIGQLPATIVYSILGQNIDKAAKLGLWAVCGVASLIAFAVAIKKYLMEKKNKSFYE